jgi:uncharacterized hydrophobic protein (TIGR00271 family)
MDKKIIFTTLDSYFNLNRDMDDENAIIQNVRSGAELKGANLWVLIFAIIIASIGLNMNSTAVIIGAMLISPLMGPLIAIGLGLSINDFELIKSAIKNLAFALIASLIASTCYFLLTPLDQAQTEILARTSPTIFDVFISFAGGLAGMIAVTRRVKGNVLPGVAIATALMPPLCTAGYGIATGSWNYFFGAFYLYFINCVFIFLGTFIIVRMMRFQKVVFLDKVLEVKIRRYIFAMITVTVLPSSYLAYNMISKSVKQQRIDDFISREVLSLGFVVVDKKISEKDDITQIDISALGGDITKEMVASLNKKLEHYKVGEAKINMKQVGAANTDIVAIKTAIIQDLYKNNEEVIKDKDKKIALLEQELATSKAGVLPADEIQDELKVLLPSLVHMFISKNIVPSNSRKLLVAYLQLTTNLNRADQNRAKEWLKVRTRSDEVKLYFEKVPKPVIQASIKP